LNGTGSDVRLPRQLIVPQLRGHSWRPIDMQLSGSESFHVSMTDLWSHLVDMNFMASVIPNVDRIAVVDEDHFTCRVRPRLSFFSGKIALSFEVCSRKPPDRLLVSVVGKGIGGSVTVDIELCLEEDGQGALILWNGTLSRKEGLFRPIGDGLISAAATRIVDELWADFRTAMSNQASAAPQTKGA